MGQFKDWILNTFFAEEMQEFTSIIDTLEKQKDELKLELDNYREQIKQIKQENRYQPKENYVETNIGHIPIEDYREIVAMQYGFDSYEKMRQEGICLGDGYDEEPATVEDEKKINEIDKFYVDEQNETIEWVYYNPDSTSGGQLVYNKFDFDILKKAMATDKPFDYLSSESKQYL